MTNFTYTRNGEPIPFAPFITGEGETEVEHPAEALKLWTDDALAVFGIVRTEAPVPAPTVEQLCAAIDAERDRRMAEDFTHDFGATPALDDQGNEIEAGERQLQMRPEDRANWQTLQGAALTAVVNSQSNAILPMRAEDNWNIQTTALQVLGVLAAMTQHGAALLFAGGALKSQQRAIYPEAVDITTGWPG